MSRIGIMLRGVLRWLGKRLPRSIGGLFVPREPEGSAPQTMAENRERALAAWEQLVSEHAPHLLRDSIRERKGDTPLRWPRMDSFASARQRAWPTHPARDYAAPVRQEQRQAQRPAESSSSRAWPAGTQAPESCGDGHSGAGANPEAATGHSVKSPTFAEQIGKAPVTSTPGVEPTPPPDHQGWQEPSTTDSDSVWARHTEWSTEPAGDHARSPDTAIPASTPGAHDWMAAPAPDPEAAQRAYDSPMSEPPTTNRHAASTAATAPAAGPQHNASPWLETPVPESNRPAFEHGATEPALQRASGAPWPDLPEGPLSSPPEEPRAGWAESDRRQRLFDEQRGVL